MTSNHCCMDSSMTIRRDPELCHGCRACELMCSFHHRRFFAPECASIRVGRDNASGAIQWSLDETCDGCRDESAAFCIRYCPYGALTR